MVTEIESRPTWEEFSLHLSSAVPVVVRVRGEPPVDLFVDPNGHRIGLRMPVGTDVSPPDLILAVVDIHIATLEDGPHLEVSTELTDLFPYFFSFALSIADGIQFDHVAPELALQRSLRDWRALLEQIAVLSPERELGVRGELWMLERLLPTRGKSALAAWTGPRGEAHDFRFDGFEIEVKTTSSEHRTHLISSDTQLTASPHMRLFLLSLQFTSAGSGGSTLREAVEGVRQKLTPLGLALDFDGILASAYHLSPEKLKLYRRRLRLRSHPYLVPIDDSFPRISKTDILKLPYKGTSRLSDVRYRLDVEGLGWEDGDTDFLTVLPAGGS